MNRIIIALVAAAALAFPAMAKQQGMQQGFSLRQHAIGTLRRCLAAGTQHAGTRAVDHYRYRNPAGWFLRTGVGYAGAKDYDNPRYYRGTGEYDRDRYRRRSAMGGGMNGKSGRTARNHIHRTGM